MQIHRARAGGKTARVCANRGINRFNYFSAARPELKDSRRSDQKIGSFDPHPDTSLIIPLRPPVHPSVRPSVSSVVRESPFHFRIAAGEKVNQRLSFANNSKESDGCGRLRDRERLIYAGVIKRISHTAGETRASGRTNERSISRMLLVTGTISQDKRLVQKVTHVLRPPACVRTAPRYDQFLISRKLGLDAARRTCGLYYGASRALRFARDMITWDGPIIAKPYSYVHSFIYSVSV